jgi:hypothetical protein
MVSPDLISGGGCATRLVSGTDGGADMRTVDIDLGASAESAATVRVLAVTCIDVRVVAWLAPPPSIATSDAAATPSGTVRATIWAIRLRRTMGS